MLNITKITKNVKYHEKLQKSQITPKMTDTTENAKDDRYSGKCQKTLKMQ